MLATRNQSIPGRCILRTARPTGPVFAWPDACRRRVAACRYEADCV